MILNTGGRTDIPAYYSEWFYNRIKEGWLLTRNPYYPQQVFRYRLTPDIVDVINFCTKNPGPMQKNLHILSPFRQFWFVTITPYGKEIEPNVPEKESIIESFQKLSLSLGKNAVHLRYDPIFISDKYSVDFHIRYFEELIKNLHNYTDSCVISFIDLYEKTKKNFPAVREVTRKERELIGMEFARIAKQNGITVRTCHEGTDVAKFGIDTGGCLTKSIMEKAIGETLDLPSRKQSPRAGCDCLLGNDIGMYNTCGHGCIYCYANYDRHTVLQNMKLHNPASPLLIGSIQKTDIIKDAKQISYSYGQLRLPL
jgi:DNA repair photolyase